MNTNISILILDDDVLQARALNKKLEKIGYQVTAVTHTGMQALQAVQRQVPDIALLDIRLSGQEIDGIDVGKQLLYKDENIILIYLTAYGNDENFQKALASKPHAFIEKPYQMKRLNWEIEMAIRRVVKLRQQQENTASLTTKKTTSKRLGLLCFSTFILIKNTRTERELVNLEDILYLKANGVYTNIFTKDGRRFCLSMVLRKFEEKFAQLAQHEKNYQCFVRVHNSSMVNLNHISQVGVKKQGGKLVIDNKVVIAVSKGYVDRFWEGMEKMP